MINLYKKLKTLIKNVFFLLFILTPITSSAEIGTKKWTKECDKKNNTCLIAIKYEVNVPDSDKKQNLATAIIQVFTTTEKKLNLVEGEEKTYKLSENNKKVPVVIIHLPLNSDLKSNPLLQIDKKDIANLNFNYCNSQIGCSSSIKINNEVIKLLKLGKELTVILKQYGGANNTAINFPLKGFTKSYDSLLK